MYLKAPALRLHVSRRTNQMKKTATYLAAFSMLVLFPAGITLAKTNPARSDTAKTVAKHKASSTTPSDTEFAKSAAEGNLAEVKLGQLAKDKGSSSEVKDFGKRMVTDHSKIDDQLKKDAAKESVTLPNSMSKRDQETYDHLSKLSGKAFDRAYAHDMVRDHRADIAAFRNESKNGQQQWTKQFASETLPMLQEHLKLAEKMSHSVEPATTTHKS
jgi:putative membrane protein